MISNARISRDELYMGMAFLVARRSTCARRAVGCVIVDADGFVLSMGYNGVAAGLPHCNQGAPCEGASAASGTRLDACQALHAEQNAILRLPDPRRVHSVYLTVSPCVSCVKLLLGTAAQVLYFAEEYPHHEAIDLWTKSKRHWVRFPFTPGA